jgi:hypothetical protein
MLTAQTKRGRILRTVPRRVPEPDHRTAPDFATARRSVSDNETRNSYVRELETVGSLVRSHVT